MNLHELVMLKSGRYICLKNGKKIIIVIGWGG